MTPNAEGITTAYSLADDLHEAFARSELADADSPVVPVTHRLHLIGSQPAALLHVVTSTHRRFTVLVIDDDTLPQIDGDAPCAHVPLRSTPDVCSICGATRLG